MGLHLCKHDLVGIGTSYPTSRRSLPTIHTYSDYWYTTTHYHLTVNADLYRLILPRDLIRLHDDVCRIHEMLS